MRMKDLGLVIEGTSIDGRISRLRRELDNVGIYFHPPCYLADEWCCPDGVPAVGVAFYLTHPRLRRLESKMILEIEGGQPDEFMRILRHETGHAMNYAFLLHRKKRWRELFGPFEAEYKEVYRVRPYSKKYVRNLANWYAQMHPDEDFAETFAVWLEPGSDWRREYAGWGALEKLEYVDELMKSDVIGRPPKVTPRKKNFIGSVARIATTLANHYKRKRAFYARAYPDFYDPDLTRIFREGGERECASDFLRHRRAALVDNIARWSQENKFTVDALLRDIIDRCQELDLRVASPEADAVLAATAYLTTLVVNYRHTGEFKRHR